MGCCEPNFLSCLGLSDCLEDCWVPVRSHIVHCELIWLLDPPWGQCSVTGGSSFPKAVISKILLLPFPHGRRLLPAWPLSSWSSWYQGHALEFFTKSGEQCKEKLIAFVWIILYSFLLQSVYCATDTYDCVSFTILLLYDFPVIAVGYGK